MSLRKNAVHPGWDDPLVQTLRVLTEQAGGLMVFAGVANGRVPASLVNAGLVEHPVSGAPTLAHVAYRDSRRVARLAVTPQASLTVHDGRRWLTAEGHADLIFGPWHEVGPDHALRLDAARYAELLREIFRRAGGGEHPDWPEYDAAMRREQRVAVLVDLRRLYGIHWD
ncbi:pyridoxamine 5'-phosphate oxidase [Nocardia sp. CDC153]|uniref:pyridoxamine 5'-phosphate oxidase n=1 Tax=Nocardia sp. CDC153 TaxID=3112167 RepID=UPI002DBD4505|nr:pyridoxamine 5'-phosphate oxidase [Nocardia sp. CDC153]MEC3956872.1 pyridoxamine 5'-phosphate oxidase [Nocardia sp. CDC153]